MNTFIKHTFSKPWYSQSEVCEVFSISETWLKTQMTLTRDKGNDLKELGHFVIDGKREAFSAEAEQDCEKIQEVSPFTDYETNVIQLNEVK